MSALLPDAPDGLTGEVLYGVLSFREEVPEWTEEAERANARRVETIAFPKTLVREAMPH
ncbi:hypothetical protein ACWIF8_28480 [Micromonospora chalcea]